MSFIIHNREITHIVKTDSSSKTQLIVQTKCSFYCDLKETYVKTKKQTMFYNKKNYDAKAKFETLNIHFF